MGEDSEGRGGDQLLQASREQDRWLDTGQGYTAKGSKADMRKPCVNNLVTCADSPTDAQIINFCFHSAFAVSS